MTCQSHTDMYRMLGVYNVNSVVLSVILNTPYFYNLTGLGKIYAAKFFRVPWQNVRRRRRETPSGQDVVDAEITVKSLILSVLGSVIIQLIAPSLTALSLWTKHRQNVNLWVIVQQWTLRPRASCIVFPINGLLGMMDFKRKPQRFVITAMSTVTVEFFLCLLSINFLTGQIRHGVQHPANLTMNFDFPVSIFKYKDSFDEMTDLASSLRYGIIFWAGVLGVVIVLSFLLLYFLPVIDEDDGEEYTQKEILFPFALLLWLPSIFIYLLSWFLWYHFLILTPDDLYCVQDSKSVDIVYCLMPVVLNLWRAVATTAPKRLPIKGSVASLARSTIRKKQDDQEIELAERNVQKRQSSQDIEGLKAQNELREFRNDERTEESEMGLENDNLEVSQEFETIKMLAAGEYLDYRCPERHFAQDEVHDPQRTCSKQKILQQLKQAEHPSKQEHTLSDLCIALS